MIKVLFAIICSIGLSLPVQAQVTFACIELRDLFNRLPEPVQKDLLTLAAKGKGEKESIAMEWGTRMLIAEFNGKRLNHLGLRVNQFAAVNSYDSILRSFTERILLRLSFDQQIPDLVYTAESLQIQLFHQNKSILFAPVSNFDEFFELIRTSTAVSLENRNHYILVKWENDNQSVAIVFPNNYQLITGKNRIELDAEVHGTLKQINGLNRNALAPGPPFPIPDSSRISVIRGGDFMGHLNSDMYYSFEGSDSMLIFNPNHLSYSILNLLQNKELCGHRTIDLKQSTYGETTNPIRLPLDSFLDYFEKDFDTFAGLESCSADSIDGTLVFRHRFFDFIHLIHFKTDSTELFSDTGRISADFLSNIPIHNLGNLFMETPADNNQPKIDVYLKKSK